MLRVGIIGAGLIGNKRAAAMKGAQLIAVNDISTEKAQKLAQTYSAEVEPTWQSLVKRRDLDAVIIATSNNAIPLCALGALAEGKHVLAEKPAGRNSNELREMIAAAEKSGKFVGVGFNHRFHPGFQKAKAMLGQDAVGPLMYIRARYGHGGRIGYDREWRADPKLSGGGELLDQGVHLIDLCRWLGGELELQWGRSETFFWDMPVDDNGFMLLKSPDRKQYAFLHASCTEWKNLFDFEIFGRTGKLQIHGLGRSYGTEELRFYKMKPEMGPPEFESTSFTGEDQSWQLEFEAFLNEIVGHKTDLGKLHDALRAIEIVEAVYRQSAASQ